MATLDIKGKPMPRGDQLQGTLELLILKTLDRGPNHGFGITLHVEQVSAGLLRLEEGSLYPALHRLEQQGWITAHWAESETGRQAKFYSLTETGRAQLEKETANWNRLSQAINIVVAEA